MLRDGNLVRTEEMRLGIYYMARRSLSPSVQQANREADIRHSS
jgi:hypothetical protein